MRNFVKKYKNTKKRNDGFTLFMSIIIISIMVTISVAVLNISVKESVLSSLSKESQKALHAADSGIECILYWDLRGQQKLSLTRGVFPTYNEPTLASPFSCFGTTITAGSITLYVDPVSETATTTFSMDSDYCVEIEIAKKNPPSGKTTIISRGRNTCDTTVARRVERAIRATY